MNGILYAVGGGRVLHCFSPACYATEVGAYDPATDAWTSKASTGIRKNHATATVGGRIYMIGGDNDSVIFSSVEAYDPATDTWTPRAPMPTARSSLAAGVVDGIIYVVGGGTTVLEAYDPATNTWTTKAPVPTLRSAAAAVGLNGRLYVIGGLHPPSSTALSSVDVYDPATNSWGSAAPMPTARWGVGAEVLNGRLYAIGGFAPGVGSLRTVEAYDPVTNSWSSDADMPTNRTHLAVGVVNGVLYAVGGSQHLPTGHATAIIANVEAFTTSVPTGLPSLSIGDVSATEGHAGATDVTFTVSLSFASSQTVTVGYATANGTASAGTDYTASSGTLTFPPNATSRPIAVSVTGDMLIEGNETFFVNLSGAAGATIADAQGQATLLDDDSAAPTLSINDVSVLEGAQGTTGAVFTVSLSAASAQVVSVAYATANGTGVAGLDYAPASGSLSFPVGTTSRTISVAVNGDTDVEPDETFFVNLSGASGATLTKAQGLGTINDDDGASGVRVSVDDRTVAEGSAVNASFRVSLSARSAASISVEYATADDTARAGPDYAPVSGTLVFPPGRTEHSVHVPIVTDLALEGNEIFRLNLSSATGAAIGRGQAIGTIQDPPAAARIPMYRAYNPPTDYHFFATETSAKDFAVNVLGFQDESWPLPFEVWNTRQPGTLPLFRMYNPNLGRHYYTAGEGDREFLKSIGMIYEKDEGFIYASPASGTTPLFRLYNKNSGTHLFTADQAQKNGILVLFTGIWEQHTDVGQVFPAAFPAGGIALQSISASSADPFQAVTLSGTGFLPTSAGIAILLTPEGASDPLILSAVSAGPNTIELAVPPLIDPATGTIAAGRVSVQVLQLTESGLATSNTLRWLTINGLPGTGVPAGTLTRAYLQVTQDVLAHVRQSVSGVARYASLSTLLGSLSGDVAALLPEVTKVVQDPSYSVDLTRAEGSAFVLDAGTLGVLDGLILAQLRHSASAAGAGSLQAEAPEAAPPFCHDAVADPLGQGFNDFLAERCLRQKLLVGLSGQDSQKEAKRESQWSFAALHAWATARAAATTAAARDRIANALALLWSTSGSAFGALGANPQNTGLSRGLVSCGRPFLDDHVPGPGLVLRAFDVVVEAGVQAGQALLPGLTSSGVERDTRTGRERTAILGVRGSEREVDAATSTSCPSVMQFEWPERPGVATLSTVARPLIEVAPATISFGSVAVGTAVEKTVSISNAGPGTLAGQASVSGAGFSISGPLVYSVPPNPAAITVRFAPQGPGTYHGALSLTGGGGAVVPLHGNGSGPNRAPVIDSITATPASISVGQTSLVACAVSDADGDTLTIKASLAGGGSLSPTSGTLAGGGTFTTTYTAGSSAVSALVTCEATDSKGASATPKSVGISVSGAPVSRFDGNYAGSYSGSFAGDPESGPVAFSVSNGKITVTQPGSGSGTVDESGKAAIGGVAPHPGVTCTFNGTFTVQGTAASAGGPWNCSASFGSGSGTWSATRQ